MDTQTYASLPRRMRSALSGVHHIQRFRWSASIAWAGLLLALALCSLGIVHLLCDDIQFRRASFSSQELREWESYATLVGKDSLAELVASEKKSKAAGLADAWVSRDFLTQLTTPATHSSPPSAEEAAAIRASLPAISALMAEKESLRVKIHKSLTSWETCNKPSWIFGPTRPSATSTDIEVACYAMANYSQWNLVFMAVFVILAIVLGLFNLAVVILESSSRFLPAPFQLWLDSSFSAWLDEKGDLTFARLESLSIALSSLRRPGRPRPAAKPRRL